MIYLMFVFHWLADFVFQTDEMATKKSKSNFYLLLHTMTYSLGLAFFSLLCYLFNEKVYAWGPFFFIWTNFFAHTAIDYCTSRASSRLWANKEVHNFFVVIGFDQLLHAACLLYTYKCFLGGSL